MAEFKRIIMPVDVGDGATHFIPCVSDNFNLNWRLMHGYQCGTENDRRSAEGCAAAVIEGFEYLLCRNITLKEAIRRLHILRKAYKAQEDAND